MSGEEVARWDSTGGAMWFDREEWGVIIDALIQHRGHADQRKVVNSESTSDVRAEMCADLINRLNAAALGGGATLRENESLFELRGGRFLGIRFRVRSPRAESK